jgi:hypothetical protein
MRLIFPNILQHRYELFGQREGEREGKDESCLPLIWTITQELSPQCKCEAEGSPFLIPITE